VKGTLQVDACSTGSGGRQPSNELEQSLMTSMAGELLLSIGGNEENLHIFSEEILRCLDPPSISHLKCVSRMTRDVVTEAAAGDFRLQMGKILYLKNKHNERFQRQLRRVERQHEMFMLVWVFCNFVAFPTLVVLWDWGWIPQPLAFVPCYCSLIPVLVPRSVWHEAPRSGLRSQEAHERALWKITERKLFSKSDRLYLRLWGVAITWVPVAVGLSSLVSDKLPGLVYLAFIPCTLLLLIPIASRFRQTGQWSVMFKQTFVAVWIMFTAIMNWLLIVNAPAYLRSTGSCDIFCCNCAPLLMVGAIIGWCGLLTALTVAFPVAFTIANFSRKWYISALCGCCAVCFEITVLAGIQQGLAGHRQPAWVLALWPVLGGIMGCLRLAQMLITNAFPWLMCSWLNHGESRRTLGAAAFVLPPMLPPTIGSHFLEPEWRGPDVQPVRTPWLFRTPRRNRPDEVEQELEEDLRASAVG